MTDDVIKALGPPHRRNWTWYLAQLFCRGFFVCWLRMRTRGRENVPASGPGLFVSNHQSFLDPMLIGVFLQRPISYLARDSLFRVPIVGGFLRRTYVMPINRRSAGTAVMRQTIARLHAGFLCGIFPEGTRSADGTVGVFKSGFIALVRRSEIPILPVGVAGANRALGRGAWFLKPYAVCVVYGEPISVEEIRRRLESDGDEQFVEFVRQRVMACQREAETCLGR